MRHLLLGAIAPAAFITAAPADARSTRVDIPVQIDPNSSVYITWVKVKAGGGRTLVSGYVRRKRWFARSRGDLHIEFLRHGQLVACQETAWTKYRFHSRGQWRFATSADVSATTVDTIRISHVIHDREEDRTPDPVNACSGLAAPTEPNSGGA
jgi:uncharacterized protein YodC (DUF2158 family)